MNKRRINNLDLSYLDIDWDRSYKPEWSDSAVELTFYKGQVLVSVPYGTPRAKALQEQTGFVVAGSAFLHDKDIDGLIKLLREGRRLYKQHRLDATKIANCSECSKIFGSVCKKHLPLFKKYGKKKSPSRVPSAV